jgi:hypothetical protein
MGEPDVLLLIGVHREELVFGEQVAAGLDPGKVAVLRIGEGISGRRPRADERFHYDTLHRELYQQLLGHVRGRYRLVIDLHAGIDQEGPCADIYCADVALQACLKEATHHGARTAMPNTRLVPLNAPGPGNTGDRDAQKPYAATVIPPRIWNNSQFRYVGVEIYLPRTGAAEGALVFTRELIALVVACAHRQDRGDAAAMALNESPSVD